MQLNFLRNESREKLARTMPRDDRKSMELKLKTKTENYTL